MCFPVSSGRIASWVPTVREKNKYRQVFRVLPLPWYWGSCSHDIPSTQCASFGKILYKNSGMEKYPYIKDPPTHMNTTWQLKNILAFAGLTGNLSNHFFQLVISFFFCNESDIPSDNMIWFLSAGFHLPFYSCQEVLSHDVSYLNPFHLSAAVFISPLLFRVQADVKWVLIVLMVLTVSVGTFNGRLIVKWHSGEEDGKTSTLRYKYLVTHC